MEGLSLCENLAVRDVGWPLAFSLREKSGGSRILEYLPLSALPKVVPRPGLEPGTCPLGGGRAIQLCHRGVAQE